jgi:ankyrin repeat protein
MFTPGNEWIELLLAHGLEASAPVHPGSDALPTLSYQLSQAVKRGHVDRVELLLRHGADATAKDSYNQRSNYENAVLSGSPKIAALLLDHGAVAVELTRADRFRAAVMQGDEEEAQVLLLEEATLIEQSKLLIDAVDSPAATRLLLDLGADPNTTDGPGGRVALHEAAWNNQEEVIQLLLDAGASCDVREEVHQATPIGFANHAGHFKTRDRLLDCSRGVFELSYYDRADQLAVLLGEAPSLATERVNGRTPLHNLGEASERVVELLLEHGADVNGLSNDGDTPLDCALAADNQAAAAAVLRIHGGVEARR